MRSALLLAFLPLAAAAQAKLTITTTSLPDGLVGVRYIVALTASDAKGRVDWSGTGLPDGLNVTRDGTISGVPLQAGQFNVALTATDRDSTATKALPLTIGTVPPLTIDTASPLPDGTAGQAYSALIGASGGYGTYSWSATGLPQGLTINSASGTISGVPAAAGTYSSIAVKVSDALQNQAIKTFALTIAAPIPPLSLDTTSLPAGVAGSPYSARLAASGGNPPYTWAVTSGVLAAGLSLSADGNITGTPSAAGNYDFRIQVTDRDGRKADRDFRITIGAGLKITTTDLPGGSTGTAYRATLQASGGTAPYTWTIASGALPSGLSLDASGVISGTPTSAGNRTFTVQAADAGGQKAAAVFTIVIGSTLSITSASQLPGATTGTAYSYSFRAAGGSPPYSWTAGGGTLPSGLSLDPAGILSGVPGQAGSFSFVIRVTDQDGSSDARTFDVTVAGGLTIVTGAVLPDAGAGVAYPLTLQAAGGSAPYQWSVTSGSLPPGLTLSSSGAISGTPNTAGSYRFTVQVKDASNTAASKEFTVTVTRSAQITSPQSLPAATAGTAYSYTLQAAGGATPYRWSVLSGSLPPGLTLNTLSGLISGTPTAVGEHSFTIRLTDANNGTDSQAFTLTVTVTGAPGLRLTGVPQSAPSLEQYPISLTLDRAFPVNLGGRLALSFTADASAPADDPAIQFSTGGRTVDFTVPANTTQVPLPSGLALQTGSIAGTITITALIGPGTSMAQGGSWAVAVARTAPVIRSVRLAKTGAGFEVWITGYSNSRDLGTATFTFQQGSSSLGTASAQVDLTRSARDWYTDSGSRVFGSQFTIIQPFTVNGNQDAVAGVTVTLTNSQGASLPVSAQF